MIHTFVSYVDDKPGVLTRVSSLFRRLNINIISLTVGRSERPGLSRMTIVCEASAEAGHRIRASMYKLENVLDVDDIAGAPAVTRELALIKVAATKDTRSPIFELVEVFRARIVDLAPESLMIEMTGVESKIEGLIQVLTEGDNEILEVCRSGKMTMRRGHHTSRVLKALGAGAIEPEDGASQTQQAEEGAVVEPE
ncbi:acetolactate synthase small subunit [Occallatibacter riparius]|uniref:Acetolactate synthase small subunit n=1 Tax=Occallatibacter riparius TaxID=1002689 RepID=A0A9J7BII1_9BACT|nr:acetolactate synthase small subunit [Occallatibacter riparius]UWZ82305.1 acetolactate synthase small subunit [Occallatibacter riparius]